MPYLIIFLFSLCFLYRYDIKKKEKYKKSAYFFLFILFVLTAGCRYVVGGDTVRYMRYWEYYPTFGDDIGIFSYAMYDPFWMLLNVCCKFLCSDFIFFQFVHALLLNWILFYGVFKRQNIFKEHYFSVVFFYIIYYFIYFNMEVLRESLAVAIFLLSIPAFQQKKWLKYYLFAVISFLFHSSAIIVFIFPVFRYIAFKKRYVILTFIFVITIFILLESSLSVLFVNPIIQQRFDLYKDASMNFNGRLLRTIIYFIIPLFIIYVNDYRMYRRKKEYIVLYMVFVFVASISAGNTAFGGRFINYIAIIIIGYYVHFIYGIRKSLFVKNVQKCVLVLLVIIPFIWTLKSYFGNYSFILQGKKGYFLWFPYTDVFHIDDSKQKNIIEERIYFADELMLFQTQ